MGLVHYRSLFQNFKKHFISTGSKSYEVTNKGRLFTSFKRELYILKYEKLII